MPRRTHNPKATRNVYGGGYQSFAALADELRRQWWALTQAREQRAEYDRQQRLINQISTQYRK